MTSMAQLAIDFGTCHACPAPATATARWRKADGREGGVRACAHHATYYVTQWNYVSQMHPSTRGDTAWIEPDEAGEAGS